MLELGVLLHYMTLLDFFMVASYFSLPVLRMYVCLYIHFEGMLPCAIITDNISIIPDSSIVMM